jgi:regulator of sigma E protease
VPGVSQVKLLEAQFADLVPAPRFGRASQRSFYTGLEPAEMFVVQVDPGSPADLAGLRPGDLITTLEGEPVKHWMLLDQRLQSRPDHTWTLTWQRTRGDKVETMSAQLKQVRRKQFDEYGHTVERLVFGARSDFDRGRGELAPIDGRFGYAISRAIGRTGETIGAMVSGFWSILRGQAPRDSVGGPLMMYRVASVSGHKGWDSFLLMLALISVNLGLINLLPIPVLDGGHILTFAVEAVLRKPLSARMRTRIQYAGLLLVGIFTILALKNDVMRYIIR